MNFKEVYVNICGREHFAITKIHGVCKTSGIVIAGKFFSRASVRIVLIKEMNELESSERALKRGGNYEC